MTSANGTSASQSDKAAAIDYLKRLKAGEKAERPAIHDAHILAELDTADFLCTQAGGNLETLSRMYQSFAAIERGGKSLHPLFAEVLAEEEEQTPAGILYSEIERKEIRWLWKGRLAFGKLTAFDGNPGEGKTSILCDVTAKYSRGWAMPGEEQAQCPAGGVVLIMIEDDPSDTIIHRLDRAGADLTRISHLAEIPAGEISGIPITRSFNLHLDLPLLIREIERVKAGLVVLDPLAGLIGKTSTNDSTEMYSVLDPIAAVARAMDVSVIFTRHLNKQQAEHSLYRGAGTMAIIGRARFGLIVGRDPENEEISVLANHKNNPVKKAPSLSYQVTSDDEQGDPRSYVKWLGINKHSSQQLFEANRHSTQGVSRLEIFKIMEAANRWMTIEEVWKIMAEGDAEIEYENVKKTMQRMEKSEQIKKEGRGRYAVPCVPSVPLPYELGLEALS